MTKTKCDCIFVILVYRNTRDLEECIESIRDKVPGSAVVVVNAYYDDASRETVREIAERFGCDFLSVENRGYSYGNNTGIEFACGKYDFRYVFISNPDVIVKEFDAGALDQGWDIVAPGITAADGREQNPISVRESALSDWFTYQGLKKNNKFFFYAGVAYNKILRTVFQWRGSPEGSPVYAAHGSFVGLSKKTVETLGPRLYDENMFLFGEEGVLALLAKRAGLTTAFTRRIRILHKEDGSMKLSKFNIGEALSRSGIYYYETYRRKRDPMDRRREAE